MIAPGFTYVPVLPKGDGHLYVVMSEPTPQNRLAVVNFTTRREGCDESCIVYAHEHRFFTHDSVAHYLLARAIDADILDDLIAYGSYEARDALAGSVLRRVQNGALVSPYPSGVIKQMVRATIETA